MDCASGTGGDGVPLLGQGRRIERGEDVARQPVRVRLLKTTPTPNGDENGTGQDVTIKIGVGGQGAMNY